MPNRRNTTVEFEVPKDVLGSLTLAALSGVRSLAPPALLSRAALRGGNLRGTPFAALASDAAANALGVLMFGEIAGDKTPLIPARTSPGSALGRALCGALVGSALFAREGRDAETGAFAGGVSALAGLYTADRARKWASQRAGVPDPLWGSVEDLLVILGSTYLLRAF